MKSLEKYTQTRIRRLKALLKGYNAVHDSETLHSIRVEIKKIKAVLQAIGSSQKKFRSHKRFLPFRDIFRKAGAIREPEVFSQLMLKYNIQGVSSDFVPDMPQAEERFKEDLPVFLQHIDEHKNRILKAADKTSKKDFLKYLRKTMKQIKRGLYPSVNEGILHKTRKSAKTADYLLSVTDVSEKKYLKFLKAFEDIAGGWHDKQSLLAVKGIQKADKETLLSRCNDDVKSVGRLARRFYEG